MTVARLIADTGWCTLQGKPLAEVRHPQPECPSSLVSQHFPLAARIASWQSLSLVLSVSLVNLGVPLGRRAYATEVETGWPSQKNGATPNLQPRNGGPAITRVTWYTNITQSRHYQRTWLPHCHRQQMGDGRQPCHRHCACANGICRSVRCWHK